MPGLTLANNQSSTKLIDSTIYDCHSKAAIPTRAAVRRIPGARVIAASPAAVVVDTVELERVPVEEDESSPEVVASDDALSVAVADASDTAVLVTV